MDFKVLSPMTEDQEAMRKRVVLTLVVIAIGCVFIAVLNIRRILSSRIGKALVCVGVLLLTYAHIEPFLLRFSYSEIRVKRSFEPFTAVQLSDIHLQWPYPYVTKEKLDRIVDRVNKISPDFVFLTGDYVSRFRTESISRRNTREVVSSLSRLRAKKGVFAVLGNNDRCAWRMILDEFEATDIVLLRNRSVVVDGISITGIDSCKTVQQIYDRLNDTVVEDGDLKILLSHEPDTAEFTNGLFDLQLSGHTHGGQCIAPFGIGPVILPTMGRKWGIGLYKVKNMLLYVTSGVGLSPLPKPLVRFNNRPEVSVLRIVSDE